MNHTVAWSELTGEVFAFGGNHHGNLGIGSDELVEIALNPTLIESLKEAVSFGIRVSEVQVGDSHTIAIMNMIESEFEEDSSSAHESLRSRAFVWGDNTYSQLGLRDITKPIVDIPHLLDPAHFQPELLQVTANSSYSAAVDK